ncbi:hypothetical protein COCNU_scaffold028365G000010 [Cocos nucifera]|nr:hypothetical protein [Cocos nucifera]
MFRTKPSASRKSAKVEVAMAKAENVEAEARSMVQVAKMEVQHLKEVLNKAKDLDLSFLDEGATDDDQQFSNIIAAEEQPQLDKVAEAMPKDIPIKAKPPSTSSPLVQGSIQPAKMAPSSSIGHQAEEDVKLMTDTGLEAYKFSISWSRLVPNGRGAVNPKGLEFYNNLIDELIKHGIQPHAALYHLDLPQVLEDEYGGWLSPKIVDDFTAYADACFREFGDRVSHWTTMIQPNIMAIGGYDNGLFPPNRCSYPFGINCLRDFNADIFAEFTVSKNVTPGGQIVPANAPTDPQGLQHMLEYLKEAYGNPPIYIQENGYGLGLFNDTIHDTDRIDFLSGFIGSTLDAVRNGSDVRGYFVWSFLDVFELLAGYLSRFGLYYVDFDDEKRERVPKLSAFWYSDFLKKKQDMSIERTGLNATSHAQQ